MREVKRLVTFLKKQGYKGIKLKKMKSNHLGLKGQINGIPADFLLDTGASATVLDHSQIKQFKIKNVEDVNDEVAGLGSTTMKRYEVQKVKILLNDFEVKDLNINLVDLSHVNAAFKKEKIKPIHGIIGADILEKYAAIIDYPKKRLYFKDVEELEEE